MKDFSNLKIGVVGANGRMGLQVQEVLKGYGITCIKEGTINEIFNNADLVIDFSSAEGLEECLQSAQRTGKTLVSGSTPMSDELMQKIQETSKHAKICWSANMSLGIALMKKVAEMLAKSLPENEFDSEILEAHHSQKADAPSGTAVAIGKVIAKGRGVNFNDKAVLSKSTNYKRKKGDIGFASIRGGSIFGQHSAMFIGQSEQITISHEAFNRKIFAEGAVKCALKLLDKTQNGFYTVEDLMFE